ncbi:universal stress protein [Kaistia dalseonensis]|uniref:Nucleotide-binding universal stress UspA family protein n=1 Tax=Kaistia dalseonensis TaxID=410840 RepID=A0ABU0H6G8_9HYPH|nr:universal stress protein [Kaistia dalseonensis]MCX5495314.1 universal stress protein [Kaistia dalseonensis]MDQ0437900.1 nucleotide-binding universal stress UspA family protein [Kaistia dalseonensis]
MNPATLMVHVDDGKAAAARIRLACDLAERFGAVLIGIAGAVPEPPLADPFAAGAMVGELAMLERERAEDLLKNAKALFDSVSGTTALTTEWRSAIAYPSDLIARQARAADLIIVGRDTGTSAPNHSVSAGDVLMKTGRPVLIVPPQAETPAADNVLIAWKDGREAQRAVVDALPFLRLAQKTSILAIHEPGEAEPAENAVKDVAGFLARHGVPSQTFVQPTTPYADGSQILAFAHQQGADLVVMGGYGHARLREWVFGGVTHDVLADSTICCLLSH